MFRTFLPLLAALALTGFFATDVAEARRPNVLFLFTDDQRADTIRALGNEAIVTPNLDRLAESGTSFRNAYCMGGDVGAVCLPSRWMLQTGRAYFKIDRASPENVKRPNFPLIFNAAGYVTYHHGKAGNTPQPIHKLHDQSHYVPDMEDRTNGYPGRYVADDAVAFLEKWSRTGADAGERQPFYMYLAFGNPHDPRVVNKQTLDRYDLSKTPLPKNYLPIHPFDNGDLVVRDEQLLPWPRTQEDVRKELRDYYAVITYMDEQIGRILEALRATGEYEQTIIIFSSDQGLAMGSHGLMGKQNLYEDGMKVPMIFTGPGIPRGKQTAAPMYLLDVLPTVCELAGLDAPAGIDGRSMKAEVLGDGRGRETIFLAYKDAQRAVRQGDWKLIRYPLVDRTQLFNLAEDPHETKDLSGDKAHADRIAALMNTLAEQQKLFGDSAPLKVANPAPAAVTAAELTQRAERANAEAAAKKKAKTPGKGKGQGKAKSDGK